MQVANLKGQLLDYWVGRANGSDPHVLPGSENKRLVVNDSSAQYGFRLYEPTRDWAIAGQARHGRRANWKVCRARPHPKNLLLSPQCGASLQANSVMPCRIRKPRLFPLMASRGGHPRARVNCPETIRFIKRHGITALLREPKKELQNPEPADGP
jgi:hypothetical protein